MSGRVHCSNPRHSAAEPLRGHGAVLARRVIGIEPVGVDQTKPVAIILGAGFSVVAGVPLASQLLGNRPDVDRVTRQKLVDRVVTRWETWRSRNRGATEQYLAELERTNQKEFHDAAWFIGLTVALRMGQLRKVGANLEITKHNLDRTSEPGLEKFWTVLFGARTDVSVITTNFDILAERGLRHVPRPKVKRPGFHYGFGPESLQGGGYPSYSHIQKIKTGGHVPVLKLHGSVSWSVRNGELVKYHDCRPAIRGDAAIVAPIVEKTVPDYLEPTWMAAKEHLCRARTWIVVGYSLPPYDQAVRALLREAVSPDTAIHVFDPDSAVASRFRDLTLNVRSHRGLPDGINELNDILM